MGRTEPSYAPMAQQGFRKDQRAKSAKAIINQAIPKLLASDARARQGIENARLFSGISNEGERTQKRGKIDAIQKDEPANTVTAKPMMQDVKIRIQVLDTLTAARGLHRSSRSKKNVAILNMASPLRPGGGVLNGATSQEEFLCARTTLLPSLREEWYRLPEVGGIFSPDVLVFRIPGPNGDDEIAKSDRFYVDVISSAMIRFPDLVHRLVSREDASEDESDEESKPVHKEYANQKDQDLALQKMRAVIAMLVSQKSECVVLGAWGCGAYGNPVHQISAAWKRAILGTRSKPVNLGSIKSVVFAIQDARTAEAFANAWGGDIEVESKEKPSRKAIDADPQAGHINELAQKIETLELQLAEVRTPMLRQGLEDTLQALRQQLANEEELNNENIE